MARRVREDARVVWVRLVSELGCAEREERLLGGVDVVHPEVQMELHR